jgi:oligoribonuclease NrnB/cAMP/cGMP phosphodiesterase (DHH superfamily)
MINTTCQTCGFVVLPDDKYCGKCGRPFPIQIERTLPMSKEILIVYHAGCMDGFASAWIAYHSMRLNSPNETRTVKLMAVDYNDPISDFTDKDVYILDFSWYDVQALLAEVAKARNVVMLDHHIKSFEVWGTYRQEHDLPSNFLYHYMSDQSGAGICWGFFEPGSTPPLLIQHIQDRDLWNFSLQGSREVHAVLKSEGFLKHGMTQDEVVEKLQKFSQYALLHPSIMSDVYRQGQSIIRSESVLIDSILERNMTIVDFPLYTPKDDGSGDLERVGTVQVPAAEMPYDLASEAGNIMYATGEGYPFSVTYETQRALGKRKFSIRSDKKTGMDVGAIAVQHGGGGHANSAGWYDKIIDAEDYPWD